MYTINEYEDKFKIYELKEENTNSWIQVCPERGGIITGFGVEGKELLYLDEETFYNKESNIRGGIPILFPICGQLEEGKYDLDGKTYYMKNHGVARVNPWEVIDTCDKEELSITLRLKSSSETEKSFPFNFELIFKYILREGKLRIEQQYLNNSSEPMPIYSGFHPYFNAKIKDISYKTDASKYLDYNDMKVKEYNGKIDLTDMVESAAFVDAEENKIAFELTGLNRKITLEYGNEFKYLVIWSVKDKDFICVEPWMAQNGAFNTKKGIVYVKQGEPLKTYFDIKCTFNL